MWPVLARLELGKRDSMFVVVILSLVKLYSSVLGELIGSKAVPYGLLGSAYCYACIPLTCTQEVSACATMCDLQLSLKLEGTHGVLDVIVALSALWAML